MVIMAASDPGSVIRAITAECPLSPKAVVHPTKSVNGSSSKTQARAPKEKGRVGISFGGLVAADQKRQHYKVGIASEFALLSLF